MISIPEYHGRAVIIDNHSGVKSVNPPIPIVQKFHQNSTDTMQF